MKKANAGMMAVFALFMIVCIFTAPVPAAAKKKQTIKAKAITFVAKNKEYTKTIKASAKGGAKLSFSSDSTVCTVKGNKIIFPKNYAGHFIVTIKAAATSKYKAATKRIDVLVIPRTPELKNAQYSDKLKALRVKWSSVEGVDGYMVQLALDKKFKYPVTTMTPKKSIDINVLPDRMYYLRVCSYREKTTGRIYFSKWSKVRKRKTVMHS